MEVEWSDLSTAQQKAMLLFNWTDNLYKYSDYLGAYKEDEFLYAGSRFTKESAPCNTLHALWRMGFLDWYYEWECGDFYFLSEEGEELIASLFSTNPTALIEFSDYFKEELGC